MLSDPKTDRNRLTLCSCFCGVNLKGDHPPIVVLVVFCDVWSDLKTEEAGYELDWSTEDRRKLDNFIVGRCIRRSVLDEAFTWVPDPIADALAKVSTAPPLPHTRNGSHARVRPGATYHASGNRLVGASRMPWPRCTSSAAQPSLLT